MSVARLGEDRDGALVERYAVDVAVDREQAAVRRPGLHLAHRRDIHSISGTGSCHELEHVGAIEEARALGVVDLTIRAAEGLPPVLNPMPPAASSSPANSPSPIAVRVMSSFEIE